MLPQSYREITPSVRFLALKLTISYLLKKLSFMPPESLMPYSQKPTASSYLGADEAKVKLL
jgi:hypothetical protein